MDKLVIIDEGIANGRWPSIISLINNAKPRHSGLL